MTDREVPWRLLGLGGVASLCCIGTTAGGAAVGGAALAGGAIAGGFGAGAVEVLVTVLTIGVVGLAWWQFGPEPSGESDPTCERD